VGATTRGTNNEPIAFRGSGRLLDAGGAAWILACGLGVAGFGASLLAVREGPGALATETTLATLVGLLEAIVLGLGSLLLALAGRTIGRDATALWARAHGPEAWRSLDDLTSHGRRASWSFTAFGGTTFVSAIAFATVVANPASTIALEGVVVASVVAIVGSVVLLHAALHLAAVLRWLRRHVLDRTAERPLLNLRTYAILNLMGSIVVGIPLVLAAAGRYPSLARDACVLVGGSVLSAVIVPLVGAMVFFDVVRTGLSIRHPSGMGAR